MSGSQDLHQSIMTQEILELFKAHPEAPQNYFDGTFGRGGHIDFVRSQWPQIQVTATDYDYEAVEFGLQKYSEEIQKNTVCLHQGSFGEYFKKYPKPEQFDLALLDLGVSSPQLDQAERGFSFYKDGPLDMRMNRKQEISAATIINEWEEEELIEVFRDYGEIYRPFRVVRALVHDRKEQEFTTTVQLAQLIERVDRWKKKGKHPATQYFLALRLVVNRELEVLKHSLQELMQSLKPGGVLAVLSFHSLEDRIVKYAFRDARDLGVRLNKKVICATDEEQEVNPRSRSAKLRGFQKHIQGK